MKNVYSRSFESAPPPRNIRNFKAFTLAEVLITLGIIGVVAALTMPSLIQNKQEKERVSQLKKVYSSLSQAFIMAVSQYGTPDEWGMSGMYDEKSHYIFASNMAKFLKLSQNCIDMDDTTASKVCKPPSDIDAKKFSRSVILLDGTRVTFRTWSSNCSMNYSRESINKQLQNTCGSINIDLNGNKKPNKNGEDRFSFYFTKDAIIPMGIKDDIQEFLKGCNISKDHPYTGFTSEKMFNCAAWVLYNENMDYLHCDDLSWGKKTRCK